MNMYIVSTGCYSDMAYKVLFHESNYSAEEFKEICKKAVEPLTRRDDYLANLGDVVEQLTTNFGFKKAYYLRCHLWDYSEKDEDSFEVYTAADDDLS